MTSAQSNLETAPAPSWLSMDFLHTTPHGLSVITSTLQDGGKIRAYFKLISTNPPDMVVDQEQDAGYHSKRPTLSLAIGLDLSPNTPHGIVGHKTLPRSISRSIWLVLSSEFIKGKAGPRDMEIIIRPLESVERPTAPQIKEVDAFQLTPSSWGESWGDIALGILGLTRFPSPLQTIPDEETPLVISQAFFWQLFYFSQPALFLRTFGCGPPYVPTYTLHDPSKPSHRIIHPLRPPKPPMPILSASPQPTLVPPTLLYSRFIPSLKYRLSLHLFPPTSDNVSLIHKWLNDPRVDKFWKDSGTEAEHKKWLEDKWTDPHNLPVVAEFTGENGKGVGADETSSDGRFAFFELYWAKEDRIGGYYRAGDYDRGIHMLVGEKHHRGPHKVAAWLPSLVHAIFLADSRTNLVVSEPDATNEKMTGYLKGIGFRALEGLTDEGVNMGHKMAWVSGVDRNRFFQSDIF